MVPTDNPMISADKKIATVIVLPRGGSGCPAAILPGPGGRHAATPGLARRFAERGTTDGLLLLPRGQRQANPPSPGPTRARAGLDYRRGLLSNSLICRTDPLR